jgi:hypothetical protein
VVIVTMKRVWSTPSVVQGDLICSALEGHGIKTHITNDLSAQFTGIGYPVRSGQALPFAWPEIWVEDEDYERAAALIQELLKDDAAPTESDA